jgi:hypothetical protein
MGDVSVLDILILSKGGRLFLRYFSLCPIGDVSFFGLFCFLSNRARFYLTVLPLIESSSLVSKIFL